MMDGIKILNVISCVEHFSGWSSWGFLLAVLAIIALVGIVLEVPICKGARGVAAVMICGFASVLLFGTAEARNHYYYEVTIDDSVQMNDFAERYNIIEQRDKIYIIEEKDPEMRQIDRTLE